MEARVAEPSPRRRSTARQESVTLWGLFRQFLPLSFSDVTMAFCDPAITATLTHMPESVTNLAAAGVAKSIAVFFESPIIMLLHASNAFAAAEASRRALRRFMLAAIALLAGLLTLVCLPAVFGAVGARLLGIEGEVLRRSREVLLWLVLWPAAIGWRRYFQGLLIRHGHGDDVGKAGILRVGSVAAILAAGYSKGISGFVLAGAALIGGALIEAACVTAAALWRGLDRAPESTTSDELPSDFSGVWRFYWPLANSMVVVWGGRVLLICALARSADSHLALAVWPAAWGVAVLVANATRMVQQVVIRNRGRVADGLLLRFVLLVGAACSLLLLALGTTPVGQRLLTVFAGSDPALAAGIRRVVLIVCAAPLLVCLQNAAQGRLIGDGRTRRVNLAAWLGTGVLLGAALIGVRSGMPGATAAAIAMMLSLSTETLCLGLEPGRRPPNQPVHAAREGFGINVATRPKAMKALVSVVAMCLVLAGYSPARMGAACARPTACTNGCPMGGHHDRRGASGPSGCCRSRQASAASNVPSLLSGADETPISAALGHAGPSVIPALVRESDVALSPPPAAVPPPSSPPSDRAPPPGV